MSQHDSNRVKLPAEPLFPVWFRGLLIVLVTVVMSACQAPANLSQMSLDALADDALAAAESEKALPQQTTLRFVMPEEKPAEKKAAALQAKPAQVAAAAKPAEPASPSDVSTADSPAPQPAQRPGEQAVETDVVRLGFAKLFGSIQRTSASSNDIAAMMDARLVPSSFPESAGSAEIEHSPSDMPAALKVAECAPIAGASCPVGTCETGNCPIGCGPAACPPTNQCAPHLRGPRDEYLCDGGDYGERVDVNPDWSIDGLEQEDTIAHFDTLDGEVCVCPSNKVCIYAPRFGAVRRVVNVSQGVQREFINVYEEDLSLSVAGRKDLAATSLQQVPPAIGIGDNPPSLLINRMQPGELEARVVVRELKSMIKPYCNLQVIKLGIHDNAEKLWLAKAIVSALTWTGDQAAQVAIESKAASVLIGSVSPGVIYTGKEGKPCLRLIKCASCDNARPGEEIEFTLRFDNIGGQVIGNVTIVDNLTTRLEYVPDTAEASVEANFSTKKNDVGSLILRWEIDEPLKPGEGGILQFKVKVR